LISPLGKVFGIAVIRRIRYAARGKDGNPMGERVGRLLGSLAVLVQLLAQELEAGFLNGSPP
jgi:hypothetical protein